MTKGLRIIVCAAAALTLAALLVLLLTPAQARYLRTAQWQAAYPEETAEFASDFLTLQGTTNILLADWSPEQNETKQVSLHLTCPAEWLQEPVTEETAEGQEAAETADGEPVKVTWGAVDEKYLQVAEVQTDYPASDDTAKVTVTLTLTAAAGKTDDNTGITVPIPLSVSFVGAKETFAGKLILTLWPAAENGTSGEESGLFTDAASMKEYDPKEPFCVQYTLPTGCTAAEMTLVGAGFPAKTRYSTDNGASYTVLYENRSSIPVTEGSTALLVDMSEASPPRSGALTLRLTADGQDGKVFTDTLELTEKDWNGSADVTYTEDGLPTMTIQPWNSGCLEVEAKVERLAWTEDAALEGEQAGTDQQQEKRVAYVNTDNVIQIDWTPINASESDDPAAAEAQTMTLLPVEGISRVPAGTYRVRLCWKSGNVLVAEQVIPFFVTW